MSGAVAVWDRGQRLRHDSPGWWVNERGCHLWTGARNGNGYGCVTIDGKSHLVHRVRYLFEVGPIPDGHELDHFFCSNGPGGCCNPYHCRPVAHRENSLRGNDGRTARNAAKTHCPEGHELAGGNLLTGPAKRGQRSCRICHNARRKARYHARRRG